MKKLNLLALSMLLSTSALVYSSAPDATEADAAAPEITTSTQDIASNFTEIATFFGDLPDGVVMSEENRVLFKGLKDNAMHSAKEYLPKNPNKKRKSKGKKNVKNNKNAQGEKSSQVDRADKNGRSSKGNRKAKGERPSNRQRTPRGEKPAENAAMPVN